MKIYINGNEDIAIATTYATGTLQNNANPFEIGQNGNYNGPLDGFLSNAQIFNTALSGPEVETLYNYGSPIQNLANIPQSSNLKAWYKLDASEVYNSSTTEWEVSDATAAIKTTNLANPGSNYYNNSGNNLVVSGDTSFTVSTWFYASTTPGSGQTIILMDFPGSVGNNIYLAIQSDSKIRAVINNHGGWSIGNTVTLNQWNLISLTWDASVTASERVKFYINGQPAGFDNTGADVTMRQSTGARISAQGSGTYTSKVLSSNAITWSNIALSSSEVLTLYNSFSPVNGIPTVQPSSISAFPQSSNITGWFKLDGNGLDSSGSSNNALPVGGPISGPSLSNNNGTSSGMTQANLVQSDLQTVAPYSKYAMSFDAAGSDRINFGNPTNLQITGSFSVSIWIKQTTQQDSVVISKDAFGINRCWTLWSNGYQSNNFVNFTIFDSSNTPFSIYSNIRVDDGNWHHLTAVYNASNSLKIYINGSLNNTNSTSIPSSIANKTVDIILGESNTSGYYEFAGSLSNASIWNTALTSAQVTELYNEGLPSNLNSHSAYSNLVSWWQLGENSSFDGNNWICADEKGTNNGASTGMPVGALVNGVGTTANGISSGMSEGNLVGDAPYSTANAMSSGMSVVSRVTDVPPTPPFLLDDYPSDAAYSLRKLSSTYTGDAIRVRRTNDNTEQNIGFDGNYLDESALSNFCGSNDGRVVTWYDQSGSGFNITQPSAFFQPIIYDGTSGIIKNFNKPAVKFATSQLKYNANPLMGNSQPYTAVVVVVPNNTSGGRQAFYDLGYSNSASEHGVESGTFRTNSGQGGTVITTVSDNTHYLSFGVFDGTSTNFTINGTLHNVTSGGTRANEKITLGSYERGQYYLNNGFIHEFIFYTSDKTSEKTEIQNNINTYYSIY